MTEKAYVYIRVPFVAPNEMTEHQFQDVLCEPLRILHEYIKQMSEDSGCPLTNDYRERLLEANDYCNELIAA